MELILTEGRVAAYEFIADYAEHRELQIGLSVRLFAFELLRLLSRLSAGRKGSNER